MEFPSIAHAIPMSPVQPTRSGEDAAALTESKASRKESAEETSSNPRPGRELGSRVRVQAEEAAPRGRQGIGRVRAALAHLDKGLRGALKDLAQSDGLDGETSAAIGDLQKSVHHQVNDLYRGLRSGEDDAEGFLRNLSGVLAGLVEDLDQLTASAPEDAEDVAPSGKGQPAIQETV